MANFDGMFGPHARTSATHATCTITMMGLIDVKGAEITVTAESVTYPDTAEPATLLTLTASAAGQGLKRTFFAPPTDDCWTLLFQMYMSPSDHLVQDIVTPFVQAICFVLGRPMIRVVKPEPVPACDMPA
jgi:hypothetical protein